MLELEDVGKHYREAGRERTVLREVTLQVRPGEFVAVWGQRRSGRTTLLRIAAGIETPDRGEARFQGRRLHGSGAMLGQGIGYVLKTLRGSEEQAVLEQVAAIALARGASVAQAREHARAALRRVGAEDFTARRTGELTSGERLRVALARALCSAPTLLVIDEPTETLRLGERDEVLALLRRLAAEGLALLVSTSEPDELAGSHRALTLAEGQLRGQRAPTLAPVVALRRSTV